MRDLTKDRPKPLVEVGGKALIDHAMHEVAGYGPETVVANLHYFPDQIEAHLADKSVLFSRETTRILETGGGLKAALPLLGPDPVFTMNTDAVWRGPNPLKQLAEAWKPDQMDALLLCIPRESALGHKGKGDFLPTDGTRAKRGPGLIYSGVQIIKTERVAAQPEEVFSLNVIWDEFLARKALHILSYSGTWCDVGQPESIALAETLLDQNDV